MLNTNEQTLSGADQAEHDTASESKNIQVAKHSIETLWTKKEM